MIPRAPALPSIVNDVEVAPRAQAPSSLHAARSAFLLFIALLVAGAVTARLVAAFFP
jgi:hypothetical protein